jgi:hypothetical protein
MAESSGGLAVGDGTLGGLASADVGEERLGTRAVAAGEALEGLLDAGTGLGGECRHGLAQRADGFGIRPGRLVGQEPAQRRHHKLGRRSARADHADPLAEPPSPGQHTEDRGQRDHGLAIAEPMQPAAQPVDGRPDRRSGRRIGARGCRWRGEFGPGAGLRGWGGGRRPRGNDLRIGLALRVAQGFALASASPGCRRS